MLDLVHRVEFWIATLLAILLKLASSPSVTLFTGVVSVVTAVAMPLILTDAAMHWLLLDPITYTIPMAALIALTGEHLARLVLQVIRTASLESVIRAWRGK